MKITDLFNKLNNNDILVINPSIKNEFIKYKTKFELENKKILPFKVITEDVFLSGLTFKYDEEIILNSLDKLNLPISIIEEMMSFLPYDYAKHDQLHKFYLENEKYLIKNDSFMHYIKNKNIFFIEEPIYLKYILNKLSINYEVLSLNFNVVPNVLKFSSKTHEILYLFESILKEVENNTPLSDIYIANVTDVDIKEIKRFSNIYGIPLNLKEKSSVFDYKLTKLILDKSLEEIKSLITNKELLIQTFETYYKADQVLFDEIIESFIKILNKYPSNYEDELIKKVLTNDLKQQKINQASYKEAVEIVDIDKIPYLVNKRVFIIHAVYEVFPSIYKDNAYLSDKEKIVIGYPTSHDLNDYTTKKYENIINHENIVYISYSLKDKYTTFAPSDIILPFIKNDYADLSVNNLTHDTGLPIYKDTFKNYDNGSLLVDFNPEFKLDSAERKKMDIYIKQSLMKFTPTQMIEYIKSPFIFYLKHILLLSNYEINVNTKLGNFFHTLVEVMYMINYHQKLAVEKRSLFDPLIDIYIETHESKDFELNTFFEDIKEIFFKHELEMIKNVKDGVNYISLDDKLAIESLFFVEKNKDLMLQSLDFLLNYEADEQSAKIYVEKEIEYKSYKGRADLIKIDQDEKSFSMIDFKSGAKDSFNKDHLITLLNSLDENFDNKINFNHLTLIQLLIYAYLLSISEPGLVVRDVAYFSFLENDLKLNALYTKDLNETYYKLRDTRLLDDKELEHIYMRIESLLGEIEYRVKNLIFTNDVRKSTDYKQNLKNEDYKLYQAITFYSKYSLDLDEGEDTFEDD